MLAKYQGYVGRDLPRTWSGGGIGRHAGLRNQC